MAANDASEAAAFGGAYDVYELLVGEDVNQDTVTSFGGNCLFAFSGLDGIDSDFLDHADRRHVRLGEMAGHGLVDLRGLDEVDVADLSGFVAVLCEGLELGDDAWASLENGDGVNVATLVEQLGHADLFTE